MSDQCYGNRTPRARARTHVTRVIALAGCLGVATLAGCSRSPGEQALSDASIKLASLDVGVGSQMPEGVASATYNEVIQTLSAFSKGQDALAADASVLIASAQRGLGIRAASGAASLEKLAIDKFPGIRARLRAWQMYNAAAAAAGSYDPAPELARIDQDTRARQGEAEQARAKKAAIEKQIGELLAQVADRIGKASALRDQAGTLQLKIAGVSATEGLELAKQVRDLSRQADELELEARGLQGQADRLEIDLRAATVEIDKLASQIELLGQSRAAVQARDKAAKEDAARARGDAQQAAVEIGQRVDSGDGALTPFREQQIEPKAAEAMKFLNSAVTSANNGKSARKSNAQIAIGQAKQSLADAEWTSALGLDAYAQLLEELANARPALPAAAEYATRSKDARAAATEAKQAAYDAYQAAKSAYEASGATGATRELIDQVSTRLNAISRRVGDGVVDAEAMGALEDPEPSADEGDRSPAGGVPDEAVATGDPEGEVRDLLQTIADAAQAGKFGEIGAYLEPESDTQAPLVTKLVALLQAEEQLDTASASAFGEAFTAWAAKNPQTGLDALNPTKMFAGLGADAKVVAQNETATVALDDPNAPVLHLKKIDGEWKLLLGANAFGGGGEDAGAKALAGMIPEILDSLVGAYDSAAKGVQDGSLRSNQAVLVTIQTKLQAIGLKMMQLIQQSGGGGG
ncbi:MAG: hypothetical protein IPJ41_12660 [Phycisphaerales bacterium]|nr:hypothetical protein [Phycisphaerales bacterium]